MIDMARTRRRADLVQDVARQASRLHPCRMYASTRAILEGLIETAAAGLSMKIG